MKRMQNHSAKLHAAGCCVVHTESSRKDAGSGRFESLEWEFSEYLCILQTQVMIFTYSSTSDASLCPVPLEARSDERSPVLECALLNEAKNLFARPQGPLETLAPGSSMHICSA